jgi:Rrf2 family protein
MVGYAATALGYIAMRGDGPVQVREIASAARIPAPYLAKIVHQLSRRGLVLTRRGSGGGVQLACDPAAVTLYELCEALDEPLLRPHCLLGMPECTDDAACPAHAFSCEQRARRDAFLKHTTLLDIGKFDAVRRARARAAGADPPSERRTG